MEIVTYRLTNAQQQIATMSDLARIKLPASKPNADDATVLFNGLRTGIARISYMHGILQDANAALNDSLDEISAVHEKISALEDRDLRFQMEIAAGDAKASALEESYSKLQAELAARIVQFNEMMSRLRAETADQIAQHAACATRLQRQNTNLDAEIIGIQNLLSDKIGELRLIQQSRSWRITRPLRFLSRFVARLMWRKAP